MNNEQRQVFWDTLRSLDGKDLETDCKRLQETIMFPKYLYRYRPASLKSIEALRTNRLYFSTANYYDDPFDTFINIDLQDMKRVFDELSQNYEEEKIFEAGKAFLTNIAPGAFSDEMIEKMVHALGDVLSNSSFRFEALQFVRNIRNEVKKDIWSVCFSENGFNEAEMDRLISIADSYGKSAIYCTYEFAAQMVPAQGWVSDEMRNQKWSNGYLANYKGHQVIVMAQSYEDEKNEIKIIDPSLAYIIPTGAEKPVKIAFEGQTIVDEYTNYDRSREIQIYKKVGVRAIFSNAICVYQNTSLNRDYTLPVPDTTIGN